MNSPVTADPLVRPAVTADQGRARYLIACLAILLALGSLWQSLADAQPPATLIVLDLSQSMRAGAPPRYVLAVRQVKNLLTRVQGPVGLITCAARSRLSAPLSTDLAPLQSRLADLPGEAAHPDLLPVPDSLSGTRLATGLALARTLLEKRAGQRQVVLVSDGDDPAPDDAAKVEATRLAEAGVHLVVVPVGREGVREPIPADSGELTWKNGPVRSEVRVPYLEAIARSGHGLLTRQTTDLPNFGKSLLPGGWLLLASSAFCWIWYLADPFRGESRTLLALASLSLVSSCGEGPRDPEPQANQDPLVLLREAASREPTDPARSLLALQAENGLRAMALQGKVDFAHSLHLLQALVLVGESTPMDRNALLEARELALESADALGPELDPWLNLIRWRLAQCPNQAGTRPQEGDSGGEGPGSAKGDPGGTGNPNKLAGKPSLTSKTPKEGDTKTEGQGIPGTARLPVVLDDREPQPLGEAEARRLLRAALDRDRRKSRQSAIWSRDPGEIPDW